jgi:hypothetical protein
MLRLITAFLLATATESALAEFSCEQISDGAVRASCIAERQQTSKSAQVSQYQKFIADAKSVMTVNFKDPGSAQWRNLFISEIKNGDLTTWFLCGEVNAKNSYGAYIGFKAFIADSKYGHMQGEVTFDLISGKACVNSIYKEK